MRHLARSAGALLVALVVMGSGAAQATAADGPTAARYASAWLSVQLDAGIPMQNFGAPDWGVTMDAALGMAAAGSGGEQIDAVWSALVSDRETAVAPGGVDSPGRLARAILLGRALGEDPRSVGAEPGADLVARLESTRRTAGDDQGLYGHADPTYDGAFRQGYALAALVAVGVTPDPSAVQWLVGQQCGDGPDVGAWMSYRSDRSVPCAFDAELYVGPDTNATAAAITGLRATAGYDRSIESALDWLDRAQETDGGWGQLPGFGTDPNSTALVLQALLAAGVEDDPRFDDRGANPLVVLLSFQLGCDAPEADRGAFTYPGSNGAPNGFATAQAVAPAVGAPVLFTPSTPSVGVTPLECSSTPTTEPQPTVPQPTVPQPTGSTVPPASILSTTPDSGSAPEGSPVAQVGGTSQVRADPYVPRGPLPVTGAEVGELLVVGLAMLGLGSVALGAALLMGGRRRAGATGDPVV